MITSSGFHQRLPHAFHAAPARPQVNERSHDPPAFAVPTAPASQSWILPSASYIQRKQPSPSGSSESDKASTCASSSPAPTTSSPATSVGIGSVYSQESPPDRDSPEWARRQRAESSTQSFAYASSSWSQGTGSDVEPRIRPNPRRTAVPASWRKPQLVRQEHRRQVLVEQLVGK